MTEVREHIKFFSSLQTRATGYQGNFIASEYIYNKFLEYGLENVTYHNFTVIDAISHGANITLHFINGTEKTFRLHPILPNNVVPSTTPQNGLEGKLVYAGKGFITDFPRENISDSIVLMDWYSENNWINAAKLGAKAVIFLPPENYKCDAYGNRVVKYLQDVPLYFPRFYVENGSILLNNLGCRVTIRSDVRWENITSRNIMGWIKGTKWPDDIIMLTAHYDSYSYAPTIAPGAQESAGIAALLEFAKYLSEHRPARTILFVAYGGHHQALAGARAWHYEYLKPMEPLEERMKGLGGNFWYKILLQLNLDLSTGSDIVSLTPNSFLANLVSGHTNDVPFLRVLGFLNNIVDVINQETGKSYCFITDSRSNHVLSYKGFTLDSEYARYSGIGNGMSFITALDSRPFYYTPFDTIDKIGDEGFCNLKTQLELIRCFIISLIENEAPVSRIKASIRPPSYWSGHLYEYSLKGRVAMYDPEIDWYKPVSNALVYINIPGEDTSFHPYNRRFTFTDEEGNFEFKYGLGKPYPITEGITVYAWVVNSTGNILYGPDMGIHRYGSPTPDFSGPPRTIDMGYLTVCKASTIVLFDVVDPSFMDIPQDVETGRYFIPSARVYETASGIPATFGSWMVEPSLGILLCVVPPETSIAIGVYHQAERFPFIILTNTGSENQESEGYTLKQGEQLRVVHSPLEYAKNFYYKADKHFKNLLSINPDEANSKPYNTHQRTKILIEEAKTALQNFEYAKAYNIAQKAWINERRVYIYTRTKIEDSVNVVLFLSIFLVPFTLIMERLVFHFEGKKKIIPIICIFAIFLSSLYLLHPGFRAASNPLLAVIGISSLILTMPLLFVIFQKTVRAYRETREKILGKHIVDIPRISAAFYSFREGIENMRRFRFRSVLTITSIMLVVASLLCLVSITPLTTSVAYEVQGTNLYEGIYIHKYQWGHGNYRLSNRLVDYVFTEYVNESIIAPRAWLYTLYPTLIEPPLIDNLGNDYRVSLKAYYNGTYLQVKAFLGLTTQESEISQIDNFLVYGRWFLPTDSCACILTDKQAEELGIKAEDLPVEIIIEGTPFNVIGIISSEYSFVQDIDGEELTPIIMDWEAGENPWSVHYPANKILILQYQDVIDLGGSCSSISLKPANANAIDQIATELFELFSYPIFFSIKDNVYLKSERTAVSFERWEFGIIPILIIMLCISNILIGSVYERRRLIDIYATLGLSPFHIAFMFLAEAIVYAVLGGILAYLVALIQMRIYTALMPSALLQNYSSSVIILALILSMGTTVISALIPSITAARMVTPSLERTWKIPTKPVMNAWEIPMPFTVESGKEAEGIINFLREYFESHLGEEALGFSVRNIKVRKIMEERKPYMEISMETRLTPYELGVTQLTMLRLLKTEADKWKTVCILERRGGTRTDWMRLNKDFLNMIREQLLLWKTLTSSEKEKYMR